jgi:hypothetical protein
MSKSIEKTLIEKISKLNTAEIDIFLFFVLMEEFVYYKEENKYIPKCTVTKPTDEDYENMVSTTYYHYNRDEFKVHTSVLVAVRTFNSLVHAYFQNEHKNTSLQEYVDELLN